MAVDIPNSTRHSKYAQEFILGFVKTLDGQRHSHPVEIVSDVSKLIEWYGYDTSIDGSKVRFSTDDYDVCLDTVCLVIKATITKRGE